MTTLTTRATKGSELTHGEMDANFKRDVDIKTTTYAALVTDNRTTLECNHATTPFTVTLGDAATMAAADTGDYEITIANIGAAAVTVARAGSDTIDGAATSIVLQQYSSVTLKVNAATNGYNTIAQTVAGLASLTAAEVAILDGATLSTDELNYVDGVTSAIQGQIDAKLTTASILDEDDMATDSATLPASQQSVKAYVDAHPGKDVFVTAASGQPVISDTTLFIQTAVAEATWESVGPTGSGADNIWTALDGVPTGVDWIEVKAIAYGYGTGGTASAAAEVTIYARENGSSSAANAITQAAAATTRTDASGNGTANDTAILKIPVSSVKFDVIWTSTAFANEDARMYLTGYGYNA